MARPKGSQNKVSKEVREQLASALEGELERLPDTLASLEPKDRAGAIAQLIGYIIPKLREVSGDHTVSATGTLPDWMNQ